MPLLLIENHQGQVSFRLAGPKDNLLHEASKRLTANRQTEISITDAKALIGIANNIPIIYLRSQSVHDGHYTVFLPKIGPLASEIMLVENASYLNAMHNQKMNIEVREDVQQKTLDKVSRVANKNIVSLTKNSNLLMASPATQQEVAELLQLAREQYPMKPLVIELVETSTSKAKPKALPIKSLMLMNSNPFRQSSFRVVSESALSMSSKKSATLSVIQYKEKQQKHKVELLELSFRKSENTRVIANDFLEAIQAMHQLAPNQGYIVISPNGTTPSALFNALDAYIQHTINQPQLAEIKNKFFNHKLLDFVISVGPVDQGKPILAETRIREVLENACTAYHLQTNQIDKAVYA